MFYGGRYRYQDEDPFDRMLRVALKRGHSIKGNREITIREGRVVDVLWTFLGPYYDCSDVLTCRYYGQSVFAVDFKNHRVTDFGMYDYSISTGATIRGYTRALHRAFWQTMPFGWLNHYGRWTPEHRCSYQNVRKRVSEAVRDEVFQRFRAQAPWMYRDSYSHAWWFDWEAYDPALAQKYFDAETFLMSSQNWRYFTYDWNGSNFEKRFKDTTAEKRWKAREAKRARMQG